MYSPSLVSSAIAMLIATSASAHDHWANGEPVPPWVKAICCGPEDVHHLRPEQVHAMADGWHVDGYPTPIPINKAMPSPDGDYWIFYKRFPTGDASQVYCFFTPFNGT